MNQPLISCIMPTQPHRREFVTQAIRYFNLQDYPNKELIIVDDGEFDRVGDVVPAQDNIDYIFLDTLGTDHLLTLGAKRNLAVSLARGEVICSWDDDDYYGPSRLSRQVAPLLADEADMSAFRMSLLLDARKGELWECSDEVHEALFPYDVKAGTLMYKAVYWQAGLSYGNRSTGEDVDLLRSLLLRGAFLFSIVDPKSYICVRHGGNITHDIDGIGLDGWTKVPMEDSLPPDALAFYQGLRGSE